jgi:hypothetical protein
MHSADNRHMIAVANCRSKFALPGTAGIPENSGAAADLNACRPARLRGHRFCIQRLMSPGPRHWFVFGSRTRPLPHPPNRCSCPAPGVAEGMEVVAGVEGAAAAPTVAGGFRTGAPAADAMTGIASVIAIVVTAPKSRRHIEASHNVG